VAWNALFRRAYDDGADFFYQLGDDLALVTAGWARDFPAALLLNPTRPGLGVTGPVDTQVGGRILTQSFVSRQHMEVFGAYYPSAFRNWWSDDWITQVYAPEHTRLWTHHFVRNGRGWPRYHVDFASRSRLEAEVERGRTALAAALARPSAARGPSRRIIAFSLWGSAPRYLVGAVRNAELAREHYPGWTCRFYVGDVPVATVARLAAMPNVELVGMGRGGWKGLFWRFLPASEEDVEVVIVRDVDSRLGARERAAVDAWLAGDKDVHIMRDHPEHEAAMLAGMWGVRRGRLWDLRGRIALFTRGRARPFADQRFLAHEVYPRVREHACVHDPFFEKRPFPTARRGGRFVGQPYDEHGRPL
jgi:hypothetical protein